MKVRVLLALAAVGIVCAHTLAVQSVAAQAKPATQPESATQAKAATSLWTKVPALPTKCYSTEDQWSEQNTAAADAVQQAKYKQEEINNGIKQAATDKNEEDPMAVAARMQQEMMEDPANALKNMQEKNQKAQRAQAEAPALLEREQQIEAESKTLMEQYRAAFTKALAPGDARRAAVQKRLGGSGLVPWEWVFYGATGDERWYEPERVALKKVWDQAYVANCAQWWAATGQFHAYMKRYKDFLVQERIPFEKEYGDKAELEHHKIMGVASTGWRTTTDYEAVLDYMNMARSLFDQRDLRPLCHGGACGP
jgi:hypothetical protein